MTVVITAVRSRPAVCLMLAWSAMALLVVVQPGCGPSISYSVPAEQIKRLPKSSRRSVFQAETVVTIAIDRRSTAKREIDNTAREIERTKEKIEQVRKERETASAREAGKLDLEIDMHRAKVEYLENVVEHQHVRLKLAEMELISARAQFELEKVKLVKKYSIAFDGSEEDFIDQVKSIQEDVNQFRRKVERDQAWLKREEERWQAARNKYYSSIGESSKGWWTE